jgi:LmbE family N-acetylglucosaminyl deacetylase
MFQELEQEGIEPFEVPNLWLSGLEGEAYVDITATIDRKLEALACHVSQGVESGMDWVRQRARDAGEQSELGYEYAEVFREFRLSDDEDEEPS